MKRTDATAEVFWAAFRGLPLKEQQAVLKRMLQDSNLLQDLMDLAIIESGRDGSKDDCCHLAPFTGHKAVEVVKSIRWCGPWCA